MRERRWTMDSDEFLEAKCQVRVRFQEVDSLGVTWHGHYISYFETARNAFGRQYGFGYHEIREAGYIAPLVHVELDYVAPSRFDELLDVSARLHLTSGSKLFFTYRITGEDGDLKVTGKTVQVFMDLAGELVLTRLDFHDAFIERWRESVTSA